MKRAILVGIAVLVLTASPAVAKGKRGSAKTGKAGSDQTFVMNTAKGGMAEVELGKLASEKASNADVKQFAQRMVNDHGKANDELKTLAQNKNITLPTDIDAKDKALRDRLSKLSGEAFDRAYMNAMLAGHRNVANAFRRESKMGKDPDIKAFAAKTLPTIEEHLKEAQTTDKEVVGTSGTKKAARPSTPSKTEPQRKY